MIYNKDTIKKKRMNLRSKKYRKQSFLSLSALQVILLIFIFVFTCLFGFGYGALRGTFASFPTNYHLQPSKTATEIYDDQGKMVQQLSTSDSNRVTIDSKEIPSNLKNAFIAIEDERFYEHNGVDIKGIFRALVNNLKSGSVSQGASTITQQLIKNNVFDVGGENNIIAKVKRKVQEQALAIDVEKKHSKDYIITNYLNTISLGKGTLGVEVASKYYFGKPASKLTLSECAVIASITKNPTYLNPIDYPTENNERHILVLKKMYELSFISNEEYQEALNDKNVYKRIEKYNKNRKGDSVFSYFTDALIMQIVEDLEKKYGYTSAQAYSLIYNEGLKIYSTQDSQIQKIADSTINNVNNYPKGTKYSLEYRLEVTNADNSSHTYTTSDVRKYFAKKKKNSSYRTIYSSKSEMEKAAAAFRKHIEKSNHKVLTEQIHYSLEPQVSFSLIDQKTGYIKALVGGRGKKQDDLALNRATSVSRQPGSTFKILSTYAPGIDHGAMTLGTVFDDAPYKYKSGKSVNNAERKYFGLTTVRDAIAQSDNVVAVKALTRLTPQVGFDYLTRLGFTTLVQNRMGKSGYMESDVNQALALGGITDGVTNVELTAAYATIANKGEYNSPILYTKIVNSKGEVLLENKSKPTKVMKETTAWLLTDAMKDVIKKGTGQEAKLSSNMAVAGKTGTTSNNYDFWFCGYTPYYTASIWTGYDYNTSFENENDYHKVIWAKIMNQVIAKKKQKIRNFDPCSGIEKVDICIKSGKLPLADICSEDPEHSMVKAEYFEKGTAPTTTCTSHIGVTICSKSGMIATKYCPKKFLERHIFRKRPKGATGTTDDTDYCFPYDISTYQCDIHTEEWHRKKEEKKKQKELLKKQMEELKKMQDAQKKNAQNPPAAPQTPATPPATPSH